MREVYATPGKELFLGRCGENMASCVVFDLAGWQRLYGEGTAQLIHKRNGDRVPYPCVVTVSEGKASWVLTNADTARAGRGTAELQYIVGETVVKSETWGTVTERAMAPAGDTPPAPYQSWMDQIIAAGSQAQESTEEAAESADSAQASAAAAELAKQAAESSEVEAAQSEGYALTYAQDAQASKQAAQSAQQAAESAQEAAETAQTAAETAQGMAESAVGKVSYIGENGNWYEWREEENAFADSGVKAQGPKGDQGPQGIQGPQGETGASFKVLDYYDSLAALEAAVTAPEAGDAYGVGTAEPYDIYIYAPSEGWVNNGPLQGAKGDKGDTGPQGIQGPKGDKGDKGDTGPQGIQGPQGEKGDTGEQGPQGEPGEMQDLTNYVQFSDYATDTVAGVVKASSSYGLYMGDDGTIRINQATVEQIAAKENTKRPIVPSNLDEAVKAGLVANGITLTDEEKSAAQDWLGTKADTNWRISQHNQATDAHQDIRDAVNSAYSPDNKPTYADLGTAPVTSGGTGVGTLASGQALIGNGTGAVATRAITNNTGTSSAVTGSTNLPTMNTLRYAINRTTSVGAADTSYTTYMARGVALNSSDKTPTNNGQISWTYS